MIRIRKTDLKIVREPFVEPFGFTIDSAFMDC